MATDQAERLELAIKSVASWRATMPPEGIYSVFEELEDLDQSKNKELWDELKVAIEENEAFNWEPFQKFMKRFKKRAKEGFWWWKTIMKK